jgi:diazepam-binding inhibitor (GABA receptor modulator, acyl-CoA-binding protein)
MSTQDDFNKALEEVKGLSDLDNTELLQLYGLFKQSTVGDVSGSKPGMFDLKGKAKYEAWSEQKGLSKEQAMKKYVALVKKLKGKG